MRLKVKIEWQGQPWERSCQIQLLSLMDAIFGILVAILYILKVSVPDLEPYYPYSKPTDRSNILVILLFLVASNLIQAIHAFRLCYCVGQIEGRDPPECFRIAKTWFDFTEVSYLFHIVKCIATLGYIFKVAPHPWILILLAVTLPECIFKLYILYVVDRFMQDLRRSLQYLPKFTYIPIGNDTPTEVLIQRRESDLKIDGDNRVNTLLVAWMKHFKYLNEDRTYSKHELTNDKPV